MIGYPRGRVSLPTTFTLLRSLQRTGSNGQDTETCCVYDVCVCGEKFRTCMSSSIGRRREVMARSHTNKAWSIPGVVDLNDADEIVAICRRGRERQMISLLNLPLPSPPPVGW